MKLAFLFLQSDICRKGTVRLLYLIKSIVIWVAETLS